MSRVFVIALGVVAAVAAVPIDSNLLDTDLNIPDPVEVPPNDTQHYEAYSSYANILKRDSEFRASPCNDFYNYTCQYTPARNYLVVIDAENIRQIVAGIKKHRDTQWYQAVKKAFDNCIGRLTNGVHQNGKVLRKIFAEINAEFGPSFPVIEPNANFNSKNVGEFVGFLAQKFGLNTFVGYKIQGGKLSFEEPELAFPESYFTESFSQFDTEYKASIRDYLLQLANVLNKQFNEETLDDAIEEVVKFERHLAELLSQTSGDVPEALQASSLFKTSGSVDLNGFLSRISRNTKVLASLTARNMQILVNSPTKLNVVQSFVAQTNPNVVFNYLNIRLARHLRKYFIRKPKECIADQWLREGRGVKVVGIIPPLPKRDPFPTLAGNEETCIEILMRPYRDALGRIFIDAVLPTKQERVDFVHRIKIVTNKVINGFRHQIDQLSWFSPAVKAAAYKKIDNMLYRVVYDDWIEDDNQLNDMYKDFAENENDDDFTALQRLNDFVQTEEWNSLLTPDRNITFYLPISTVNAWYIPSLNHFQIPLGILQRPMFDVNYPSSVQYGTIGYIIGHELTHGFDSQGVNYDDQGDRKTWMDAASKAKFNEMANCVIAEYNKLTSRGAFTQTEDIADNGGIRATYNAYLAEEGLYGPDPQLPGSPINQFTHNQLFFVAFARTWCSNSPKTDYRFDRHSPLHARVFGTLQNTPAFQAAFNCPVGSAYAPEKHCDVWASEVKY